MASELRIDLLKWQREVIQDKARFKVICAGRRVGKTRFSLSDLVIKALECKDIDVETCVMFVAPTNKMAMDLAWDRLQAMVRPLIAKSYINDQDIKLVTGMTIRIRGSDRPDTLRGGKLFHVVLDEYQDIKDETFEYIIEPALADLIGTATFIGTPKPEATEFRKAYDRGFDDSEDEWKSWHFTTYDNEMISKKEIDNAKKRKSTIAFEQEYMASWETSGSNLLRLEWFKTAPAPSGKDYSTFIAIDPAGFENVADHERKKKHLDFFAIAVVRIYDNGHWWVQKIDYGRWDVRESAVRVLMAIRSHKPISIGIEKGSLSRALMPYLTDLMRKSAVFAHIDEIPHGGQAKANRITYALQGLMEHGRITFNPDENWDEVRREMLAFPSEKAHDDCIDSLAYIAHLVTTTYGSSRDGEDEQDWEPVDMVAGI